MTEILKNTPLPDDEIVNEAEKDSKAKLKKFLNSEFTTLLRPVGGRGVKRELDSSVFNDRLGLTQSSLEGLVLAT